MTWTRFMDMHSGGGTKLAWEYIYIQAPEDEARLIFYNTFGRNPERVTCTCCGEDYSISSAETLEQVTAFERNCDWSPVEQRYIEAQGQYGPYQPITDYMMLDDVRFITQAEIDAHPEWLTGSVPQEG